MAEMPEMSEVSEMFRIVRLRQFRHLRHVLIAMATTSVTFAGSLRDRVPSASDQQLASCGSRDHAEVVEYERAAREAPKTLRSQIDLAMCYDQAWRFEKVAPAIAEAMAMLDAQTAAAPAAQAPAEARPVAGADVPAPRRTRGAQPDYPREASASGITGLVVLEIVIDTKGEVREAKAAKSVPGLDEAAVKAALKWKYEPTLVAGAATEVLGYAPVRFGPTTEPAASDWLEIALFHDQSSARSRTRAALSIALSKAQEDADRWSGYINTEDKGQLEGVTRPTVKKQVDPRYPRRALTSGSRDGKVILEALVDRRGNIGRVRIVGRPSQFDAASLDAALQWKFEPAMKLGSPVPCRVLLEMMFRSH